MDLAVTSTQLLVGMLCVAAAVLGLILVFRHRLSRTHRQELSNQYEQRPTLKKYPESDVFKWSSSFLKVGLIASALLVLLAFSWTQYDKVYDYGSIEFDESIVMEDIPNTYREPQPPPPPPPPPVIEEIAEDEFIDEDIDLSDIFNDDDLNIPTDLGDITNSPKPEPLPEPEPEPDPVITDKVFAIAEEMPRFPGCEDIAGGTAAKAKCAEQKMLEFIYKNIKYPTLASENGVEGTVVLSFVVDTKGNIQNLTILRDIGGGCGAEALRVVEMMNNLPQKWTPGRQQNQAVNVRFNLPVKFKLR